MIVQKKPVAALLLVVACFGLLLVSRGPSTLLPFLAKSGPIIPYTTHLVLFQFKEGTSPIAVKEITSGFIALRKTCVYPDTQRPYIMSILGGRDNSIESLQAGVSHAFILQFKSNEDRDYYVKNDPAHQAFKDAASAVVAKTIVVGFQDGVFTRS